MPMAVQLGTTVTGVVRAGSDVVRLRSVDQPEPAVVRRDVGEPSAVAPDWARYVAGVVHELRPRYGFEGTVTTTLPVGPGLSSSAALEVAVALVLGLQGSALTVAQLCQFAEYAASGVPCGIMDQLASTAGVDGSALVLDCHALTVTPVPLPPGAEVVVVHSGQERTLAGSAYADRRRECEAAQDEMGALLRKATLDDVARITDPVLARRARHVVTENQRVRDFAAALAAEDLAGAGRLMAESHASLR